MQDDCITYLAELQDLYTTKAGKVKNRPWRAKKMANELLAIAYDSVDPRKAQRLRECASQLTFKVYPNGQKRLESMNSCRVRLCPVCAWRRSLKNYYNNKKIADWLEKHVGGAWIALTLTVKSVDGISLSDEIDKMFYSFDKFTKRKDVKKIVKGFYRGLEVTHDGREFITVSDFNRRKSYLDSLGLSVGDPNPTFNLFHPHFHLLLHVNKSYFSDSRRYMSVDNWAEAWKLALDVDYLPSVDVQRVKDFGGGINGSIAEISKYSVKDADYIYPDDWDLTVETVKLLDMALAGRRLIAYGGDCREAKKILKLEDAEKGSLVDVGDDKPSDDGEFELKTFFWNTGYRKYIG